MNRNNRRAPWDLDSFLAKAQEKGGTDLLNAQQELVDLLVAMQDFEPRFDSRGGVEATYRVYQADDSIEALLWVHADGRIYVYWGAAYKAGKHSLGDRIREVWRPYVKNPENATGSNTLDAIGVLKPETIAELLQNCS